MLLCPAAANTSARSSGCIEAQSGGAPGQAVSAGAAAAPEVSAFAARARAAKPLAALLLPGWLASCSSALLSSAADNTRERLTTASPRTSRPESLLARPLR